MDPSVYQENGQKYLTKGQSSGVPVITSNTEKIIQDFHAFQGVVMPQSKAKTSTAVHQLSIGMSADGGKNLTVQHLQPHHQQLLIPVTVNKGSATGAIRHPFLSPLASSRNQQVAPSRLFVGLTKKSHSHHNNQKSQTQQQSNQKPTLGPSPSEVKTSSTERQLISTCFLGTLPTAAVKFQKIQETLLPFIHTHGLGVYIPLTTKRLHQLESQSDQEPAKKKQKMTTTPSEIPSLQTRLLEISNCKDKWNPWPKVLPNEGHYKGVNIGGFLSIESYLGGGTFGRVYKGKITWPDIPDLDGKYVAAKFFGKTGIKCDDSDGNYSRRGFFKEAEMMASIANHFITVLKEPSPVVSLLGTFAYLNPNFKKGVTCNPVILMECMDLGSVTDLLRRAKLTKNKFYVFSLIISLTIGMAKLLNDLHKAQYYHQDIKPSNFMCKSLTKLSSNKTETLTCGSSSSTMNKDLDKDAWIDYVWDPFVVTDRINYSLKIADMGFTCSLGDPEVASAGRPTGTTLYVAPEFKELADKGIKRITDKHILESSEAYSMACSYRDMFWKCRKVFNINPPIENIKGDKSEEKKAKLRSRNEYLKRATATITVGGLIGLGNGSLQDDLISRTENHLKHQNYEREQVKRLSCTIINEFLEVEKVIARILSPVPKTRPSLPVLIEKASLVQNALNDYILYVTKFQ